jgi:hypothetical protein
MLGLTRFPIDSEAEEEASSLGSGTSTSNFPPPWFTLEEIAATERSNTANLVDRVPATEAYEIRTTTGGIKAARADGITIPERSRNTSAAREKLQEFNARRIAHGMPALTLEQLDTDILITEMFICKVYWKAVRDAEGKLQWVNLHGPCNHAYNGRDGWVRHFKDEHLAKARYGRGNMQKKNSEKTVA